MLLVRRTSRGTKGLGTLQNRGEVGYLREKDDDERNDEGVAIVPIVIVGTAGMVAACLDSRREKQYQLSPPTVPQLNRNFSQL
jgi:hypothetical protein